MPKVFHSMMRIQSTCMVVSWKVNLSSMYIMEEKEKLETGRTTREG